MRAQELEHRAQRALLAQRGAQVFGRKARQRQKTAGPVFLAKNPAQRVERKRLWIKRIRAGGCGLLKNCQPRVCVIEGRINLLDASPLNRVAN